MLFQPHNPIRGDHFAGFATSNIEDWQPAPGLYKMGNPNYVLASAQDKWNALVQNEYGTSMSFQARRGGRVVAAAGEGHWFAERFSKFDGSKFVSHVDGDTALQDEWAWVVGARPWLQDLVNDAAPEVIEWLEDSLEYTRHLEADYPLGVTSGKTTEDMAAALIEVKDIRSRDHNEIVSIQSSISDVRLPTSPALINERLFEPRPRFTFNTGLDI